MSVKDYLAFGSLTALCAFLAVVGEPIGYFGLLLFGGGGAVYWYLSRVRSGTSPRGVVFPTERGALAAGVVGSAIFVVSGLYLVVEARRALEAGERIASRSPVGALVAGVLAVAFFGVLLIALIPAWLRPGGLVLLAEGVYCRQPNGSAWLPWTAIEKVSVVKVLGQRCLGFRLAAAEPAVLGGLNKWLRGWYRRHSGADLTYIPHGGGIPSELRDAVEFYRNDAAARERLSDPGEAERWQ